MGILLQTRAEVDRLLGKPVLATALLGLTRQGEKAWRYHHGDLVYTVGFLDDLARYAAVHKTSGGDFREADLLALLTAELGAKEWTFSPSFKDVPDVPVEPPKKGARARRAPGRLFTAQRTDPAGKRVIANYLGWVHGRRNQFFLATPYTENARPLPIDQAAVTARLG